MAAATECKPACNIKSISNIITTGILFILAKACILCHIAMQQTTPIQIICMCKTHPERRPVPVHLLPQYLPTHLIPQYDFTHPRPHLATH